MELWRISNYPDLSGLGGLRAAGRWHTRGKLIVYLTDHPASALLEMLVHMDGDLIPSEYLLLRVEIPETLAIDNVATLASNWRNQAATTRSLGDLWLDRRTTALMRVPSAILPEAHNYLLNPEHSDSNRIMVTEIIKAPLDPRLMAR